MKNIAALLLLSLVARAATFDIGFDQRPAAEGVTGYALYVGPTNAPVRIGGVGQTNRITVTLPDGAYRITLTSTNVIDESLPSLPLHVFAYNGTNVIVITTRPGAPLNLQLR